MKVSEGKRLVAKTTGQQNRPDGLANALDALRAAARDWNVNEWEHKVTRLPNVSMEAGADEIAIPNLKKMLLIREHTSGTASGKTFRYARYRDILSNRRNTTEAGLTNVYTVIEAVDSSAKAILFFQPFTSATTIDFVYYKAITVPTQDDEEIDIPDEFLTAFLHTAKAHYLGDVDTENPRLGYHENKGQQGLRDALRSAHRQPDEDYGLKAPYEYNSAQGEDELEAY